MKPHPTIEEIQRWKRGELSPDDVIAVGRHLAECSSCTSSPERDAALDASIGAILGQVDDEDQHPDLETELFLYADGSLPASRRTQIEQHLEICRRCREDVEDLIGSPYRPSPTTPRWILPAAVAATVILAIGVITMRNVKEGDDPGRVTEPVAVAPTVTVQSASQPETPAQLPRYERADWNELVRNARGGVALSMPAVLQTLRPGADTLRGGSAGSVARLTPVGMVIETARPTFDWPATEHAQYAAVVFDDTRKIANSGLLTTNTWTVSRDLRRGVTYTWQVDVQVGGTSRQILPAPPAAPARFHVLDERTLDELATARTRHSDDHLLLALLYARAGLDDLAAAELALVTDAGDASTAKRLLGELASWKEE